MAFLYFWYRGSSMSSQARPVGIRLFWKRGNRESSCRKVSVPCPVKMGTASLSSETQHTGHTGVVLLPWAQKQAKRGLWVDV